MYKSLHFCMPLELVPANSGTHGTQAGQIDYGQLELQNRMLHDISDGNYLQEKCENRHLLSQSEIAGGGGSFRFLGRAGVSTWKQTWSRRTRETTRHPKSAWLEVLKDLAEVISVAQKEIPKGNTKQKIKCVHLNVTSSNPCSHLNIKLQTKCLIPHTKQYFIVVQHTLER